MSWKLEVQADSTGTWATNACRFATEREAALYGQDLMRRWSSARKVRAAESDDPVVCQFDDGFVRWLDASQK
jgi:hypothetical protein